MVAALHSSRSLASGLDGGKQQPDHDSDDRNHDQKLDKREATLASGDTFYHLFLDDDGEAYLHRSNDRKFQRRQRIRMHSCRLTRSNAA